MIVKNIESTIKDLILKNKLKIYYDIGASPTKKSVEMFKNLLMNGVKIFAFDPHPDSYIKLKNLFKQNIHNYKIGIGNKNEKRLLYSTSKDLYLSSFSKQFIKEKTRIVNFKQITCKIKRLDYIMESENLPIPDLIKIDVENWEDKVIESFPVEISPIIIIEFHSTGSKEKTEGLLNGFYDKNIFQNNNKSMSKYYVYTPKDKLYIL